MNKLRIILLSALIMVLLGAGLPVTESLASWSRRSSASSRRNQRHYRRHSRAWWRRYRARIRARRERALLRRRMSQATDQQAMRPSTNAATSVSPVSLVRGAQRTPAVARTPQLPFQLSLPHAWTSGRKAANGETVFNVSTPDGRAAGTATIAAVKMSEADAASTSLMSKAKTVGGMSLTALRRRVIDRMVAEGGWVTNDLVREIQGRRVFVVIAQTGAPGAPTQSWSFYFTEVDGRVYSLATNAPVEFAAPVAAGSEQVMASLRAAASRNLAAQEQ